MLPGTKARRVLAVGLACAFVLAGFPMPGSAAPIGDERTSPALATPASSRTAAASRNNVFGVDTGIGSLRHDDRVRALKLLKAAGCKWVRVGIYWPWIDRKMGSAADTSTRDWTTQDDYINDAIAYGMTVIGEIHGYAAWANGHAGKPYYVPADTSAYDQFAKDAVARYQGRVHYWEVWNEPNGPFWTDTAGRSHLDSYGYARMLQGAYLAIKSVDPTSKVILGAIDRNHLSYLRDIYRELKGPNNVRESEARSHNFYFDILGAHPYCDNRSPTSKDPRFIWDGPNGMDRNFTGLPKMKAYMTSQGDPRKHVIITEMAWPIRTKEVRRLVYTKFVTPAQQAHYLTTAYRMVKRWTWVDAMLWYGFKDYDWKDEAPFSLINANWGPRPSYKAYRAESHRR